MARKRYEQTKYMRVTKEDKKLVKSVTDKIKRLKKNKGIDLSDEIKVPDLNKITRKEFNKFKEFHKSFMNRAKSSQYAVVTNKHGVSVLKKELDEVKKNIETDIKRHEAREKKERSKYGEQKKYEELILMKKPDEFGVMSRFNFDDISSRREFLKKSARAEKRADPNYEDIRKRQMIENYVQKLYDTFNSDAQPIVDMIYKMDLDDFYDLYKREARMQFSVVYVEESFSDMAEDYAQEISYYIQRYNEGFYNDGLKNFPNSW